MNPSQSFIFSMLTRAVELKASDVHIEPEDGGAVIRARIHGELEKIASVPKFASVALFQEVKTLASFDLSLFGKAQDSRMNLNSFGIPIEARASLIPVMGGEKIVLRLLGRVNQFSLKSLVLPEDLAQSLKSSLRKNQGLILVTGPTGSGKSTFLYSCLSELTNGTLNLVSLEDPVEYQITGVNQVPISKRLNFSDALRSVLRQDPNVILVGEIRDTETASLALSASETGHLVLSTLHSRSVEDTHTRLLSLGLNPSLLKDSLLLTIACRLIPVLCPYCKIAEQNGLFIKNLQGCPHCYHGVHGRVGVYEWELLNSTPSLKIKSQIQNLILKGDVDASVLFHF